MLVDEDENDSDSDEGYTDEEKKTFETIMKLERGFKSVVNACADDTDTFLLLIGQVSNYMRIFLNICAFILKYMRIYS